MDPLPSPPVSAAAGRRASSGPAGVDVGAGVGADGPAGVDVGADAGAAVGLAAGGARNVGPGAEPDAVTVRYWAAARAAAGRDHDRVPAGPLVVVLDAVLALHAQQPRFAAVLSVCSVLVGEDPVGDRDRTLIEVPPGSFVELLPPFAGG